MTNDDRCTKVTGKLYPSAGAALSAILASSGLQKGQSCRSTSKQEPGTFDLIGKPNPFIVDLIKEQHGLAPGTRTVMVGDRPNTDILFGKAAEIDTCLVFSGVVHTEEEFKKNWLPENPDYDPTYIMQMVGDLKSD